MLTNLQTEFVVISLLLFVQHSKSLALNTAPIAKATPTCPNHGLQLGFPPQVTMPPSKAAAELRIRQVSQSALATCGYIDGDADKAITCQTSLYCATTSTFVGCCEINNCRDIFTSCYDLLGSACDQSCQNNPQNLVCSSPLQYCARYNYEGGSIGLGCAVISGYTSSVFLSTSPGLTSLSTPSSAMSGPTTVTVPPTSSSTTPAQGTSTSPSSFSTGATAGVAVGATLAVVILAVIGYIYYRRRHRKGKEEKALLASTSGPMAPTPYQDDDHNTKEAITHQKAASRTSEVPSELPYTPRTPDFHNRSGHTSPGYGPPHYSQVYEMQASNPSSDRPISYPTTELGSSRT